MSGPGAPLISSARDAHGAMVVVAVAEPMVCPGCQRAVTLLVNRGGTTRCVACDERQVTLADAPRRAADAPQALG